MTPFLGLLGVNGPDYNGNRLTFTPKIDKTLRRFRRDFARSAP